MQFLSSCFALLLLASFGLASQDKGWDRGFRAPTVHARADPKYIVVLKPNSGGLLGGIIDSLLGKTLDGLVEFTLGAFSGFNAELSQDQLEKLKMNPNVRIDHSKSDCVS